MPTARNPLRVITDVRTEDVARMPTQRLDQRPVICTEYVDVLIEAAGHEECA